MWDTVLPKSHCSWEPVELRILKQELANMTCKCTTCEAFRNPSLHNPRTSQCNDEAVQVDQKSVLLSRYVYADPLIPRTDEKSNLECIHKDVFCPNCFLIWDLMRSAKKVYKDAESETTKSDSTDKSTEKTINFVDRTTSVTNKPVLKMISNLTLCDFISSCSSESSIINHSTKKSNNHDRVTFLEDFPHVDASKMKPTIHDTVHGNCFCLEQFVDSIRPPLHHLL